MGERESGYQPEQSPVSNAITPPALEISLETQASQEQVAEDKKFTRRDFLRMAGILAAGAVAGKVGWDLTSPNEPSPIPPPRVNPVIDNTPTPSHTPEAPKGPEHKEADLLKHPGVVY